MMNKKTGYSNATFFTGDFARITDRSEPVTLLRCSGGKEIISHAISMPFSKSVRFGERYPFNVTGLVIWMIPCSECGNIPYSGDRIMDSKDHIWTVVFTQNRIDRWNVTARNEAISAVFNQEISVEEPVFSHSPAGDQRITWKVAVTGLRAEVIPVETDAAKALAGIQFVKILISDRVSLENGCRLRGENDSVYDVISHTYRSQFPCATEVYAEMKINSQN